MSKVNIAVIGLGRIAPSHIDGIRHWPDLCELAAVVDVIESRARSFANEYEVPYYTSVDEVLDDPSIDAVVIGVPHHLHSDLAIQACNAGKHVLVEKVMATSVEEGEAMVEAAEANDVNLMIGQTKRFVPELQELHERRDEIGDPRSLLYNFSCYFAVDVAPDWWQSEEKTGGLVYPMLGAHAIDYSLWMLDDYTPASVIASGTSNDPDLGGHDDATVIIKFDEGIQATNFLSINSRPARHEAMVIGSEGSNYWRSKGSHSGGFVGISDYEGYVNEDTIGGAQNDAHNFALQMREFAESIQRGRDPTPSGKDVIPQLEIISAARRSAAEDRLVELG